MIFSTYMVSSTKHILIFKFNMGIAGLYANKKFWVDFHVFLPWISVSSANLLSLTILSLVLFPFTVSDSSNLISFLRQNLILSRWPCFLLHWENQSQEPAISPSHLADECILPSYISISGKRSSFQSKANLFVCHWVPSFPYSTHLVLYLQTLFSK